MRPEGASPATTIGGEGARMFWIALFTLIGIVMFAGLMISRGMRIIGKDPWGRRVNESGPPPPLIGG